MGKKKSVSSLSQRKKERDAPKGGEGSAQRDGRLRQERKRGKGVHGTKMEIVGGKGNNPFAATRGKEGKPWRKAQVVCQPKSK